MQIKESKVEQMKELVSSYINVQKSMKVLTKEHQNSMGISYEQLRILKKCAEKKHIFLRELLYEVKDKHQVTAANIRGLTERGLLQVKNFQLTVTEKGKMILDENEMNTYIYKAFMKVCTELDDSDLEILQNYNQKIAKMLNS